MSIFLNALAVSKRHSKRLKEQGRAGQPVRAERGPRQLDEAAKGGKRKPVPPVVPEKPGCKEDEVGQDEPEIAPMITGSTPDIHASDTQCSAPQDAANLIEAEFAALCEKPVVEGAMLAHHKERISAVRDHGTLRRIHHHLAVARKRPGTSPESRAHYDDLAKHVRAHAAAHGLHLESVQEAHAVKCSMCGKHAAHEVVSFVHKNGERLRSSSKAYCPAHMPHADHIDLTHAEVHPIVKEDVEETDEAKRLSAAQRAAAGGKPKPPEDGAPAAPLPQDELPAAQSAGDVLLQAGVTELPPAPHDESAEPTILQRMLGEAPAPKPKVEEAPAPLPEDTEPTFAQRLLDMASAHPCVLEDGQGPNKIGPRGSVKVVLDTPMGDAHMPLGWLLKHYGGQPAAGGYELPVETAQQFINKYMENGGKAHSVAKDGSKAGPNQ